MALTAIELDAPPSAITALELLEEVLGPDAEMRPGQRRLAVDVDETLRGGYPLVGRAPTGVGKSLAYLTPAALAATRDERTIVVTESISLQAQLVKKDLPRVAAAYERLTHKELKFALLKGKSNYLCHLQLAGLSAALRDASGQLVLTTSDGTSQGLDAVVTVPAAVITALRGPDGPAIAEKARVRGDATNLASLLEWTSVQIRGNHDGDKGEAGPVGEEWQNVSISAAECPGAKECVYGEMCRAERAKDLAGKADIVVTNTAMFGVHTALGIPAIDGSKKIGFFDHVIVDEAHALPGAVRQAGSLELSGRTMQQLVTALESVYLPNDALVVACQKWADKISELLDLIHTRHGKSGVGQGGDVTLPKRGAFGTMERVDLQNLADWLQRAQNNVSTVKVAGNIKMVTAVARAGRRLVSVRTTIIALLKSDGVDVKLDDPGNDTEDPAAAIAEMVASGVARWVEPLESHGRHSGYILRVQPVSVAGRLQRNGWTGYPRPDAEGEDKSGRSDDEAAVEFAGTVREPGEMSVVCVSATLPDTFPYEAGTAKGTGRTVRSYESPYEAAYAASRLYLPILTKETTQRLFPKGRNDKPELSYTEHRQWVIEQAVAMVTASKGRALVLSATAAGAKAYAEALRAARIPGVNVMSQWDRERDVVVDFRNDRHSVLVGTRSFFTGLDVQGDALSLVLIDRVPRAAGNRLDDARSEALAERSGLGPWAAKAAIYGGDAATTLEQGAGRLIRAITDRGLVAVLDPRLACPAPYRYGADALKLYLSGLQAFPNRVNTLSEAVFFLKTI